MANAIDQQADTSGQVDASDTQDTEDISLDDVSWEDGEQVDDTTEESEAEPAATEEADDTEEESDDSVEEDADDSKEAEAEDSDDEEQADPEADKKVQEQAEQQRKYQEAAARRVAEREAREKAKQEATQQELDASYTEAYDQALNAGFDDAQARIQAAQALTLKQLQLDAYTNRVTQVANRVTADLNNAVASIDLFKSDIPEVRDAMLDAVDMFEAMHVKKDANGDAVEVTGDLNAYLHKEAERIRKLTGIGAKQQEQAKNTQKKRTLSAPSRSPKKAKVDPDMAAFDDAIKQWS